MSHEETTVTAVVVVWRSPSATPCLESIVRARTSARVELVVVLNGGEAAVVMPPAATVVRSPMNLGFAAAANLGASHADGELLAFVHDDTVVGDGWINGLLGALDAGGDVVGARRSDSPVAALDSERETTDVSSDGLLLRRRTFDDIGGFSTAFHRGWFEDVDLCRRVRARGGTTEVVADAPLTNLGHVGMAPDLAQFVKERNRAVLDHRWTRPTAPAGLVEVPAAGTAVDPESLHVSGWAMHPEGPTEAVMVTVDGAVVGSAAVHLDRPDLVREHPLLPHAATAGWLAKLDLPRSPGTIELALLAGREGTWTEVARHPLTVAARPGARRPLAAFTIVQDERVFLPVWLRHYAREVGIDDLYVLDHGSTDGSTSDLPFGHVVPVHRPASFDHDWLRSTVERFQGFLLQSYDTVVFAEVDELIVADPAKAATLREYAAAMTDVAARCTGWNLVQADDEQIWDPDRPLLDQRGWWHRAPTYDKVLVTSTPLTYDVGFHTQRTLVDVVPDPDLLLVHLHRVDRELCLARHRAAAARRWSAIDLERRQGQQHLVVEDEEFARWYVGGPDLGDHPREPVPDRLRGVL